MTDDLLARQVVFCEFGDALSEDHVRFDPCHPYIDRRLIIIHVCVERVMHMGAFVKNLHLGT